MINSGVTFIIQYNNVKYLSMVRTWTLCYPMVGSAPLLIAWEKGTLLYHFIGNAWTADKKYHKKPWILCFWQSNNKRLAKKHIKNNLKSKVRLLNDSFIFSWTNCPPEWPSILKSYDVSVWWFFCNSHYDAYTSFMRHLTEWLFILRKVKIVSRFEKSVSELVFHRLAFFCFLRWRF